MDQWRAAMLRVTVEELPGGNEARKRPVAVVEIVNLSQLAEFSAYSVRLNGITSTHRVHRHKRSDGWLPLVIQVLRLLGKWHKPLWLRP